MSKFYPGYVRIGDVGMWDGLTCAIFLHRANLTERGETMAGLYLVWESERGGNPGDVHLVNLSSSKELA